MNSSKDYIGGLVRAHQKDMEVRGYFDGTDGDVSKCEPLNMRSDIVEVGGFDGDLFYKFIVRLIYFDGCLVEKKNHGLVDDSSNRLIDIVRGEIDSVYQGMKVLLIGR